jgi:hypothetical protein
MAQAQSIRVPIPHTFQCCIVCCVLHCPFLLFNSGLYCTGYALCTYISLYYVCYLQSLYIKNAVYSLVILKRNTMTKGSEISKMDFIYKFPQTKLPANNEIHLIIRNE